MAVRPGHHDPEKLQGAVNVIINSAILGGLKGGVVGLAFAFGAHRYWPVYRTLTRPFKTFIQLGFVITGGCWRVDRKLIEYERRIQVQQRKEEQLRLEQAADRGEYIDFTGKSIK